MDSIKCDYLAKAQAFYNYNIWSKFGSPKGVTIEAVRELERKMGVKFPHAFVEYLRWMGRDNPIYIGSDAYFEHILPNGPMWLNLRNPVRPLYVKHRCVVRAIGVSQCGGGWISNSIHFGTCVKYFSFGTPSRGPTTRAVLIAQNLELGSSQDGL